MSFLPSIGASFAKLACYGLDGLLSDRRQMKLQSFFEVLLRDVESLADRVYPESGAGDGVGTIFFFDYPGLHVSKLD